MTVCSRPYKVAALFLMALADELWPYLWETLSNAEKAAHGGITPFALRSFRQVRAQLVAMVGDPELLRMWAAFAWTSGDGLPVQPEEIEHQQTGTPLALGLGTREAKTTVQVPVLWEGDGWHTCLGLFQRTLNGEAERETQGVEAGRRELRAQKAAGPRGIKRQ